MTKLNVGGMQISIDAVPTASTATEDYLLRRQAAACRRAGDWEGAIAALRQRKDLAGDRWETDKLAECLQRAGRFEEAMAEIQWLLDHSLARANLLFGHQPGAAQSVSHASHSARVFKAAALICEREGRADLQAQYEQHAAVCTAVVEGLRDLALAEAGMMPPQEKP